MQRNNQHLGRSGWDPRAAGSRPGCWEAWRGRAWLAVAVAVGAGGLLPRLARAQTPALLPPDTSSVVGRLPSFFAKRPGPPAATLASVIRHKQPVIILNERLLVSYAEFQKIDPRIIEKIAFYTDAGPTTPARWRSLATLGIVSVILKSRRPYQAVRLPTLGRRLGLRGSVRYELNGLPLQYSSLRVSRAALAGLDIEPPTAAAPAAVLNVRLSQALPAPSPPVPGAPPHFYIRGVGNF